MRDMKEIDKYSLLGVSCGLDAEDALRVDALIFGDVGTRYESGIFTVRLKFSEDYPFAPPVVKFASEMFHPNINKNGQIELDILKKDNWLPSYSLTSILTSIKSLLSEPCPSWPHPANPEATDLFLQNRCQYNTKVKAIVERTLCENGKGSTVEVEARCDTDTVLEEVGLRKPELVDLTSKVVNLRRNSMFSSPRTKSKCKGNVEEAEKEVSAVPKEKRRDSKVTILKNSLARMFSRRESGSRQCYIFSLSSFFHSSSLPLKQKALSCTSAWKKER
jgi:ubiquitin-protein ligase